MIFDEVFDLTAGWRRGSVFSFFILIFFTGGQILK